MELTNMKRTNLDNIARVAASNAIQDGIASPGTCLGHGHHPSQKPAVCVSFRVRFRVRCRVRVSLEVTDLSRV